MTNWNVRITWNVRVKYKREKCNPFFLAAEGSSTHLRILGASCRSAAKARESRDKQRCDTWSVAHSVFPPPKKMIHTLRHPCLNIFLTVAFPKSLILWAITFFPFEHKYMNNVTVSWTNIRFLSQQESRSWSS